MTVSERMAVIQPMRSKPSRRRILPPQKDMVSIAPRYSSGLASPSRKLRAEAHIMQTTCHQKKTKAKRKKKRNNLLHTNSARTNSHLTTRSENAVNDQRDETTVKTILGRQSCKHCVGHTLPINFITLLLIYLRNGHNGNRNSGNKIESEFRQRVPTITSTFIYPTHSTTW